MPSDVRKNDLERLIAQRAEIERQLREHHSKELAILFSDIVGSTEIFEQKGDIEGLAMVRRHNGILFPVVEGHRGRVVKTIGDAIMAVFEMPADGVRCAADMQRALDEARARDPDAAGIHIRIGVHAGRAMLDEGDVFGDAVNTAARIVGKAGGDEVLLSEALFRMVPHGEGLVAEARGTVSLKGKAEPLPIMALDWRAARPAERGATPEIFVLDLALGRSGLKVAVLDGAGDKGPLRAYAELPVDREGLDALAHRFDAFLDGQSASYVDGLEKVGRELHDTALSDRARRHLASTSLHFLRLHVDDALAHVPFELAHDGTDFLSLRFATGRVVSTASDDELEPSVVRTPRASGGHALVVSDPSGDLPGARREGEAVEGLLREGFGGEVRHLAGPVTRAQLLEALPGCRLLHFAGHHMPSETGGFALADGTLTPAEVASALEGTPPEVVFANGCHAGGRSGFTEGARRASGLAASLLLHGVQHFVGPMGEIADADALAFALRFYESLLAGVPYGEAVRLSREALRGAGAEPLSFGRYLLYGEPRKALDPSLTRLRSGPATRAFPPRPIAEPVAAGVAAPARAASAPATAARSRGRMPIYVVAGGLIVVLGAVFGLHLWPGASRAGGGTGGAAVKVALKPTPPTPTPPTPAKAVKDTTPIAPRTGPVALAVLPFKNLTGDAKLDYLEQGLTESVITGFAGAKNLHLIEHAQIDKDVHYEEWTHSKYVDPATRAKIGKIVGCEAVVLGGYQRSGKTVRATARIIRVDTGEILAAAKVERPISRVFDLQDAVAKALRADLPHVQAALRP